MAAPKTTVTLMDMRNVNSRGSDFKVIKMANTIEFKIDEYLSAENVESLCESDEYNVTIVPYKR